MWFLQLQNMQALCQTKGYLYSLCVVYKVNRSFSGHICFMQPYGDDNDDENSDCSEEIEEIDEENHPTK